MGHTLCCATYCEHKFMCMQEWCNVLNFSMCYTYILYIEILFAKKICCNGERNPWQGSVCNAVVPSECVLFVVSVWAKVNISGGFLLPASWTCLYLQGDWEVEWAIPNVLSLTKSEYLTNSQVHRTRARGERESQSPLQNRWSIAGVLIDAWHTFKELCIPCDQVPRPRTMALEMLLVRGCWQLKSLKCLVKKLTFGVRWVFVYNAVEITLSRPILPAAGQGVLSGHPGWMAWYWQASHLPSLPLIHHQRDRVCEAKRPEEGAEWEVHGEVSRGSALP